MIKISLPRIISHRDLNTTQIINVITQIDAFKNDKYIGIISIVYNILPNSLSDAIDVMHYCPICDTTIRISEENRAYDVLKLFEFYAKHEEDKYD